MRNISSIAAELFLASCSPVSLWKGPGRTSWSNKRNGKNVWKKINLFFVVVEICVRIAGTNILGECISFLKDIGCSAAWVAIGLLTRSRSKDDQFLFQAFLPVRFQVSSLVVFVLCSFTRCQIVNRRMKKLRRPFIELYHILLAFKIILAFLPILSFLPQPSCFLTQMSNLQL